MKKIFPLIVSVCLFCSLISCTTRSCEYYSAEEQAALVTPVRDVIARLAGEEFAFSVELKLYKGDSEKASFAYYVRGGVLTVEGSSALALCHGFYSWLVDQGYGQVAWDASRVAIPSRLPRCRKVTVVSPFEHHLYYNVCTYGYTTPFWSWEEWEKELDWIALHGFDLVLSPIGSEAIYTRVWKEMGLTQEEIDAYFCGPAHLPWLRMGNMTALDGPLSAEWNEGQIALEHKIVTRMKELGINPVYNGFAGFVPKGFERVYPSVKLITTKWSGLESYLIPLSDPLFAEVQKKYITEWEREFGRGKYYLIDSFNELEIDFGGSEEEKTETLKAYGTATYSSLSAANPDAVWFMQGWVFGYQRNLWTPENVSALFSEVPVDKAIIIDLATDSNKDVWKNSYSWEYLPNMMGRKWIYSTTPNFGGRNIPTGSLEFLANGHFPVARSKEYSSGLVGYGTSPEAVELNAPIFELISEAGWTSREIDVQAWCEKYSRARYGVCPPAMKEFWKGMMASTYGFMVKYASFRWQYAQCDVNRIAANFDKEEFYRAVEAFLSCEEQVRAACGPDACLESGAEVDKSGWIAYCNDAAMLSALYLGTRADEILEAINWGYVKGWVSRHSDAEHECVSCHSEAKHEVRSEESRLTPDSSVATLPQNDEKLQLINELKETLMACDVLLEQHPLYRLERWEEMARRAATSPAEAERFAREARRLVTIWGGTSLNDYSSRFWSGLIRDYYIPRLERYFAAKDAGGPCPFHRDGGPEDIRFVDEMPPLSRHSVRVLDNAHFEAIRHSGAEHECVSRHSDAEGEESRVTPDSSVATLPQNDGNRCTPHQNDSNAHFVAHTFLNPYKSETEYMFATPYEWTAKKMRYAFAVTDDKMMDSKLMRINHIRGDDAIYIDKIRIVSGRVLYFDVPVRRTLKAGDTLEYPLEFSREDMRYDAHVQLYVALAKAGADTYLTFEFE